MWDCVIIDSNSIIHHAWEWETLTAVAFRVQPRNIAFMAVLYIDFVQFLNTMSYALHSNIPITGAD